MPPRLLHWLWTRLDLGLLAVGYCSLLVLPGSYSAIARWPACLLPQACLVLGAVLAVRTCRPLGQPFDALVGFSLAGLALSAVTSADPARGLWYLSMVGGYFALLYGLHSRWPASSSVLPWLGLAQVVLCAASLYQFGGSVVLPQWRIGGPLLPVQNTYPLGHHNFGGGLLALTLPVTGLLALYTRGLGRWAWLAAWLLGLVVLYTTQSRGSWLGVVCGLIVALLLGTRLNWRTWLGLAGAVVLAGVVGWYSTSLSTGKSQLMVEGRDISSAQRVVFWETGLKIWQDHPLLGVGPGVTGFIFPKYRTENDPWVSRTAQQLHSTPIHLLAETGLWGLTSYLGWVVCAVIAIARLHSKNRPIAAALGGALAGYGLSSLTDFQLENPAISASLVLLTVELLRVRAAPTILRWDSPSGTIGGKPKVPVRPVAVLVLVLVLAFWLRTDWAWYESDRAFAAARTGNLTDFKAYLQRAEAIDPGQPYYPIQYAQTALRTARAYPEGDPRRASWLTEATIALDRAVRLLPTDPLTLTNAGWLHLYGSEPSKAAALFRRALQFDGTTTATLHLGMALALIAEGKTAQAITHLRSEIQLFPDQWADKRWQAGPLLNIAPQIARDLMSYYDRLLARYPGDADMLYQQAMLLLWQDRPEAALDKLNAIPAVQSVPREAPLAVRLPWRVRASQPVGVRIQALWRLQRLDEAKELLEQLSQTQPSAAACLGGALKDPGLTSRRTYLASGQDYFLHRRYGGPTLEYFEPLQMQTWAAMDCIHFSLDGRNARLPL